MGISSKNTLYTGILFLVIGITFLLSSLKYNLGTASEMGPGFFPFISSAALILISVIMIISSVKVK